MSTPDLHHLITQKSGHDPKPAGDARRFLASALPFIILLGFGGVFALLFGDSLLPATKVRLENVITLAAGSPEEAAGPAGQGGAVLFQASGWIEPDPFPIKATALVGGVVESVEVLEGQAVGEGDVLARLVSDDAELDLRTALAEQQSLEAQAESHHREVEAIKAEAEATSKRITVAEARLRELADPARRLANLSNANVSAGEVEQARLRLVTQEAEVGALRAAYAADTARVARHELLEKDFEGRLMRAAAEVDRRRLALERTTIRSPINGIVQKLFVTPGEKRFLQMDGEDSATVAILFDPECLQARIDVPLDKVAAVHPGQAVRVRTDLLNDMVFHGRVTSISGGADIQRNTLQVKVRIEDPDSRLRPEMLARAEFLSGNPSVEGGVAGVRIYVPVAALTGPDGDTVWVAGPEGKTVDRRRIVVGGATRDGARLVLEGLKPGERVVVDPPPGLEPGRRIAATGEREP